MESHSETLMARRSTWQLLCVLGCVFASGVTAPAYAEEFFTDIEQVLAEHPQARSAAFAIEAARENVRAAGSVYLPKLGLNSDYGYEYVDSPGTRLAGDESDLMRSKATLTLTQNLYSGGRNPGTVDIAGTNLKLAEIGYEFTRQSLIFEAYDAYASVHRDTWLARLAKLSEETIAKQLNLEDERVERGAGFAVDVLLAKTRLQLAKERRVNFEGQLRQSLSRYEEVFGRKPISDVLQPVDVIDSAVPASLDDVRDMVIDGNLSLLGAAREIDIAKSNEQVADADLLPIVNLEGGLNYEDNVDAVPGQRRDAHMLVTLTWELFSGFRAQAASSAAKQQKFAAISNADDIRRTVVEDATRAWDALLTARERTELLRNASNIALEVFVARQKLREAGQESALNVLDAETEVFNARINQTSAEYDSRITEARLLLAMGRLKTTSLEQVANADGTAAGKR
jgi:adhesin transport system outer membrane protein